MNAPGATGPRTGILSPEDRGPPEPRKGPTDAVTSVEPPAVSSAARESVGGSTPLSSQARESDLLRRAQAGDRPAFGQFVLATQDRLYNLLVRIVGDREEARELAQDAYLKALLALPGFRNSAAPYTWLYRIAVNLAIARLRKVRRHRVFSLDAPHAAVAGGGVHGDDPGSQALARERQRQVVAALGRLDSEYRAVLVMRDVEGLDYKDISDVLELPLGTVKSRIFRARLALREELSRYFNLDARPPADGPGTKGGATS